MKNRGYRLLFTLVATISLILVSCNKDEDILSDGNQENSGDGGNSGTEGGTEVQFTVLEYTPAPGQYINDPTNGFGDVTTSEEAVKRAMDRLSQGKYVSLGSWGGYIVIKFNRSVKNSGDYDFAIGSNAFDTSNEPGIVWVMKDENGNNLPDDTWYELKGSYFGEEDYERNYWVTYSRPGAEENTPWTDSNGEQGEVVWLGSYHDQPFYYPDWISEDSYTLYGSRLPSQAEKLSNGVWVNHPFEWGYADNFGEDFFKNGNRNYFKISNAVTEENTPANLTEIDFVKVQTAVNGSADILGENSTEVTGFYEL